MFRLPALSIALGFFLASVYARGVPTSFVLVGDSTTANGTVVDSGGWGNGFCGSTNTSTPSSLAPGTPCINTAKNGATTGSFVADGSWNISLATAEAEIAKGRRTLVTIQFGHNDMKIAPPESMGANITIMVNQLRAIGAEPVLVTSLTRRTFFDNGTIQDLLGPWADETILVSQQLGTHLLDLHANSITYCEAIGPDASHVLNRTPDDDTHLNSNGTIVFGRMLANLMNASFPHQLPIIPNPELTFNITHGIASY
ncbi:SGNH hydrolase [Mycena alexandri]|uniref:SGNH hydrolase n=1 Tax=Mycena alexandri TaxID=1745969 RepID=A0AAD6T0D8_9AGAR|nr:SGNH hydrolase [Mycena alexandri]